MINIEELMDELQSLLKSKNMTLVDQRRKEIRKILVNLEKYHNWNPSNSLRNEITDLLSSLRTRCLSLISEDHDADAFCIKCKDLFSEKRKALGYQTCLRCGDMDAITTRPALNEGLPGTREDNKKMRAQVWGGIKSRNKGN